MSECICRVRSSAISSWNDTIGETLLAMGAKEQLSTLQSRMYGSSSSESFPQKRSYESSSSSSSEAQLKKIKEEPSTPPSTLYLSSHVTCLTRSTVTSSMDSPPVNTQHVLHFILTVIN